MLLAFDWSSILAILRDFRISDLIDILLVSYLFYKGIRIVRETRAMQLAKGIFLLVILYLLALLLNLYTMRFFLDYLLQIGVIAIIVIFQPELRRVLERMGRTKLIAPGGMLSSAPDDELHNSLQVIAGAAYDLSKTKTGALIVMERQTKLGEQIATGVLIDALPTKSLLGSLFFPNSPLHDGAVIIRDGRIHAAGCFLPRPQNEEFIDHQLGSRHRAAIGMSENSDAIIIIVSEETGIISVAESNRLVRDFTQESLLKYLQDRILPAQPDKEKKIGFWKVRKK